jgi:hypothetical protein
MAQVESSARDAGTTAPRVWLGRAVQVLGVLAIVAALVFLPMRRFQGDPLRKKPLYAVAGLVSVWLSLRLFRLGRQLAAPRGPEAVAGDDRPPVLYLRSFKDDSSWWFGMAMTMDHLQVLTEEEQIAEALGDIGPVIAVGRPGERLPPSGATRLYLTNEEWQERVAELIAKARLVVIRTGKGDGVMWELETALRTIPPQRLVLAIDNFKELRAFSKRAAALGMDLRHLHNAGFGGLGAIVGLLTFGDDWYPSYLRLRGRRFRSSLLRPTGSKWRWTLRPVLERLGVPWTKPAINLKRTTINLLGLALVGLILAQSPTEAPDAVFLAEVQQQPDIRRALAGTPPAERADGFYELAIQGMHRLPEADVLRWISLTEKLSHEVSATTCASMLLGTSAQNAPAPPAPAAVAPRAWTATDQKEVRGLYRQGAIAEAQGTTPAFHPADRALVDEDLEAALVDVLSATRPTAAAELWRATLTNVAAATDASRCLVMQAVFAGVTKVQASKRSALAFALAEAKKTHLLQAAALASLDLVMRDFERRAFGQPDVHRIVAALPAEQQKQRLRELVDQGRSRLGEADVLRWIALHEDISRWAPAKACAASFRSSPLDEGPEDGTAAPPSTAFGAVTHDQEELLAIAERAAVAAARGTRPHQVLQNDRDAAFALILRSSSLSRQDQLRLKATWHHLDTARSVDACWAMQQIYRAVPRLPGRERLALAYTLPLSI